MPYRLFGIMTSSYPGYSPFPEADYFARLTELGRKAGIHVFVFFPESVSFPTRTIKGVTWTGTNWARGRFPFPVLIYDRCFFYPGYAIRANPVIQKLKKEENILFLNRGLPGKWQIYNILKNDETVKRHLPPQDLYRNPEQLKKWLDRHESAVLKPAAGSHGKNIMRIVKAKPLLLEGRDRENRFYRKTFLSFSHLAQFLHSRIKKRPYLIQRYLQLNTPEGNPFDIRLFVQKNGAGEWTLVGKAVRLGPEGRLTSNLEGGGQAIPFHRFFQRHDPAFVRWLEHELERLAMRIPAILETHFPPLFELGIDIGVDPDGNPWLLEVNSKPGRQIFTLLGDEERALQAVSATIDFARFLFEHIEEDSNGKRSTSATEVLLTKRKSRTRPFPKMV